MNQHERSFVAQMAPPSEERPTRREIIEAIAQLWDRAAEAAETSNIEERDAHLADAQLLITSYRVAEEEIDRALQLANGLGKKRRGNGAPNR